MLFDDAETDIKALESDTRSPPELVADSERNDALRAAIAALPDRYRLPLVLAYFNGSSYDEIAAELDITRTHVGVLLLRARKELRRSLAEMTMEVSA
jgi:RNA polymerase sigma-70 factor (ECF subfamily)